MLDPFPGQPGGAPSRQIERVVLVHRPGHSDWSLPKGKHIEGETIEQTALREVREETGLQCRILRPGGESRYEYHSQQGKSRSKTVHYFLMEVVGGTLSADGSEVDRVEWIDIPRAIQLLTYEGDKRVLAAVAGANPNGD